MEKQLFSDVSPEKRANILRDNADNVELHSYFKQFNNDELIDLRKTLSEKLIEISDKETELNEIKENNILVPGKILGEGDIEKKITISALGFSKQAKEKLKKAGCETRTIIKEIETNPTLKGVKVL